jgi:hypothetical protein
MAVMNNVGNSLHSHEMTTAGWRYMYFKSSREYIMDEITRKQLIWYGHVERMDITRLPKITINWKPEGRKKRGRPRRTSKGGIYTAVNERDLRMGDWNNRRQ